MSVTDYLRRISKPMKLQEGRVIPPVHLRLNLSFK